MSEKSSSKWSVILKVIIAVATAVAGAFGLGACTGIIG
ncbi:smalltalk protein [Bacteroides sp. GD17]|nr:smalltalk protein [uncultured Bacteroides sp.]